ncbi:hypothetical protein HYC85_028969 [Camellia sinensis]|uniref:Lipoprotein n=1 Tax=Camellia sinensis TaxID=4442 RepID=A0A7J7FYY9_CAMSI|nr:hypothetical protein HYC85_028969 [Camellia sinensis]
MPRLGYITLGVGIFGSCQTPNPPLKVWASPNRKQTLNLIYIHMRPERKH